MSISIWLAAAMALVPALLPCGVLIVRASVPERLVALQFASLIAALVLVLLAVGLAQPSFLDLALAATALSLPGTLLFAHFLEHWL